MRILACRLGMCIGLLKMDIGGRISIHLIRCLRRRIEGLLPLRWRSSRSGWMGGGIVVMISVDEIEMG